MFFHSAFHTKSCHGNETGTPFHPLSCPGAQDSQHLTPVWPFPTGHCLASLCSPHPPEPCGYFPKDISPLQTLITEPTLAQSGQSQVFSAQEVSHFSPGGTCLDNHCHNISRARLCLEGLGPCGSITELHDLGRSSKCDSPRGGAVLPSTDRHLCYTESTAPFPC